MRQLLIVATVVLSMTLMQARARQPAASAPAAQTTATGQSLTDLVAAASRWIARFDQSLSGLLFRERYSQRVVYGAAGDGPTRQRLLEANVFLLKLPTARGFVLFRDVYRVDSRAIGDHTQRLEQLLASGTSDDAIRQARRLTDASARHNIGRFTRNVNIPTMALDYLAPDMVGHLRAKAAGTGTVAGLRTVIVEFEEAQRPTLVRGAAGGDVPAKGRYWIHPESGTVVRAEVELSGRHTTGVMRVDLELHPALGVWVPKKMTDVWRTGAERVTGLAEYSNYKRLAVSTTEAVK